MSELQLVVREADCDWSGVVPGSCADRAIAALSADPMTLLELKAAVGRFAKPSADAPFFAGLSPGLCDAPHDAGLVVIDLAARVVMVKSTYSSPEPVDDICYHDGQSSTDTWLRYHVANDWLFLTDEEDWKAVAETRRHERAAIPQRDVREVFYGRPMLEFIARETYAAFSEREAIAAAAREKWMMERREWIANKENIPPEEVDPSLLTDDAIVPETYPGQERFASPFYDTLKEIHVVWLLTPRDDLGGECPRTVALRQRDHIEWDLQDRCEQWSRLKEAPPALDESSFAFRYGGFGTHELVEYYELVRHLLWSCWERLEESLPSSLSADTVELPAGKEYLAIEIPRLEKDREQWLDTPDPEFDMRTPRSIIHNERVRLPEAITGEQAMIDPDCPCCQMLAEMSGPGFWNLDSCNMDDEFAFDLYNATREEWEQERGIWEERTARFEAEREERRLLGVADSQAGGDEASIWSSSFAVGDTAELPFGVRVFGIGCHLAELIVDLRNGPNSESARHFIDRLNRDFGNLRELLQSSEPSLAQALVNPVLDRFAESLAEVASVHSDLEPKCDSLTTELITLLDQPPSESNRESSDRDLPF